MKVYLFISKAKKQHIMYHAYIETLQQRLDITTCMEDADVVVLLGGWTQQGARLARCSKKMGIPYIVCPLGDISERNLNNPGIKRSLQSMIYLRNMCRQAEVLVATTPLEKAYLESLGWNHHVILIRYYGYSHLTSKNTMSEDWQSTDETIFANYEKRKAEAIAAKTQEAIIAQIMQIKSRMPHKNIPQQYLDDLHTLHYADNYDEDAINAELAKWKLNNYAAAVFQVMTEKTGLTEGFMPLPAKDGRKSRQILQYVK